MSAIQKPIRTYRFAFTAIGSKAPQTGPKVSSKSIQSRAQVFFALSAASAMLAFASTAILVPAATEVWGPMIFLLLWGGWTAGAIAAYWIGRLARPLVIRMGYKHKLEEYERLVSKHMKLWAALLFCIAVPSEIPGYLFGGMRYSLPKFLVAIRHRRSDLRGRLDCRGRKHFERRAPSSDSHCRNACGHRNRRGLVAS